MKKDNLNSVEKAREEVQARNISAVIEFCKQTRTICRETQNEVANFNKLILQQNTTIDNLKNQIKDLLKSQGNIITEK